MSKLTSKKRILLEDIRRELEKLLWVLQRPRWAARRQRRQRRFDRRSYPK